jgi:hypothetical protein
MQDAALAPVAGKVRADLEQVVLPSKWPFQGCEDESEPLPWAGTALGLRWDCRYRL